MQENDVIGCVPPATGAEEIELADASNADVAIPVGLYQAMADEGGGTKPLPAMLFRFRPTLAQRGKIALGEDLYLVMLLPNDRPPLPIELQVGPGTFQLDGNVVGLNGEALLQGGASRSQLWTPEQGPE
jgi:hypothetical protein